MARQLHVFIQTLVMFSAFNIRTGLYLLFIAISMTSCIVVADYGPPGRDGKAFYGVDYDIDPPYSYWDNNPGIPSSPFFGEYYRSHPGIYEFEYFINRYDYWYGTYQIFINEGLPGEPLGEPGADGEDTYLMLICNDEGFYFRNGGNWDCVHRNSDGSITAELDYGEFRFRVLMHKTNTTLRPTLNLPKTTL